MKKERSKKLILQEGLTHSVHRLGALESSRDQEAQQMAHLSALGKMGPDISFTMASPGAGPQDPFVQVSHLISGDVRK